MAVDQVLLRAAEQCRQLALLTRTEAARQQLLRMADNFEAGIKPPQHGHKKTETVAQPQVGGAQAAAKDETPRAA